MMNMSKKRKSAIDGCSDMDQGEVKKARDSPTVQLSLDHFFKPSGKPPASDAGNTRVEISPEYFGIHIYTPQEIEEGQGLEKEYRTFWNEKAFEMCKDRYTRAKLLNNKVAVHGAINTSWTLYKVKLLELRAEEMKHRALMIYPDTETAQCKMSSMEKNVLHMKTSATAVNTLYMRAEALSSNESSLQEIEESTTKELTELRKSQEALIKAMKRKEVEFKLCYEGGEKLKVEPPELSSIETEYIIVQQIINGECVNEVESEQNN